LITKRDRVVIIGAGVTGTAAAKVLLEYTNVSQVILIEKRSGVAQVNSHPLNNAQTSHDGSTETNYDLGHALRIKPSATALRRYAVSKGDPKLFQKTLRMCLAVGPKEVLLLEKRYREFKPHYPDLHLAYREELARIEPKVVEGRDRSEIISALVSTEGFIINYQELAKHFLADAERDPRFKAVFNSSVKKIVRRDDLYLIQTDSFTISADVVLFASGPYSLLFAQQLGYGTDYAILPVAGSFYSSGEFLRNKVYRVQIEGMPFAAIHGDPDILDMRDTRFGPTTKPLPLMERHQYGTSKDFLRLPLLSTLRGLGSLLKIIWSKQLLTYVIKNILFDLPVIGPALFLREVRPIVPTIRYRDLKLRRGAGGIRPQIVNLKTQELEMGDATLVGENAIFNTTPSPGASVCLGNAHRDAKKIVGFLGPDYYFDEDKFQRELGELPKSA